METIVAIAEQAAWDAAKEQGKYTQSTIDSTLADVGFIHCSTPNQTMDIANRRFNGYGHILLLMIDVQKVKPPVVFEQAPSGRGGLYPHIYGPLNVDAVSEVIPLVTDSTGKFVTPEGFRAYIDG